MTAISLQSDKTTLQSRSLPDFIGIVLALLVIGAYILLPFVNQPELGETTVYTLLAERSNNEFDILTSGLTFIPLVAVGVLLVGMWNIIMPQIGRALSFVITLCGCLILIYYINFFREYTAAEDANYLNAMGASFWTMLVVGVLMIVQVILPRSLTDIAYRPLKLFGNQESVLVFGLLLLVFIIGISNPRFLAERNVSDVLAGNAYIAVAAIGMSMVIITGNIDISVGSLVGLLAVISGRLAVAGAPIWFAWLAPLLLGAMIGAFIGFLVAYLRIPSIVVTLGMLSILKGILIIWTNGDRVTDMPEAFFLAQQRPLGIPMPIYLMVGLTILGMLWMRYSSMGRSLYAVGGNAEAARLSGLSQKRIVLSVFIINGVFAGIATVLYATQLRTIQATPPPALELSVITASVVGGVSILGGTGTVIGSTVATILLNSIRSAMIFISVSPFWLQAVQGLLILVTVLADLLRRRRQRL